MSGAPNSQRRYGNRSSRNDHDRLADFVQRYVERHGQPPEVRRAARALGWNVSEVEDAVEGDPDGRMELRGHDGEELPGQLVCMTNGEGA